MEKSIAKPLEMSLLAGPAVLKIKLASARGPFAGKAAHLSVPKTQVHIVNTSPNSAEIALPTLDRLQLSEIGIAAESELVVEAVPLELAPGESVPITISGLVPAVYASTLRITPHEGKQLAIPIEFHISAHSAWGIACMVFGLMLVGLINVLDSESGIQGDLHHTLLARQAAHEFIQQMPPPQSQAALVENINREFDAAVASLQKPRKLSLVDHRGVDAQEHLKTASELTAELRRTLSARPRGSIEVDDLSREWTNLKTHFASISEQFVIPMPQVSSLSQRLQRFNAWAARVLLGPPIGYYTNDFNYHINQIQLLYAAGQGQDAAARAVTVRRWMQRAAAYVNAQVRLLMFFAQESGNNLATAEMIRRRIEAGEIAADRRAIILGSLDEAASLLAEPFSWQLRRTVSQRIQNARTETLRAENDSVLAAIQSAIAQEEKEYSIEGIQAIIDEGGRLKPGADGKVDPREKTEWLRRVALAWRTYLAILPDSGPPTMRADLDALDAAIETNDLDAVSTHSRKLLEQWSAFSSSRARSLILNAAAPLCLRMREDVLFDLEATQQTMHRHEASADLLKWEGELDRLRMKTYATPDRVEIMQPDCLEVIGDLNTHAFKLYNEVNSAVWSTMTLPDVTKREVATDLGTMMTSEALRDLISEVRPLRIEIMTPGDELYAGHLIEFKIANLEPIWGPGVMVKIDFGDGKREVLNAEVLRKKGSVIHVYSDAKSFSVSVVAEEALSPDTIQPVYKALGEGEPRQLLIQPSPISTARRLAEIFFNIRFGLALLIAGIVYFWRFHAKTAVFGAIAFDYAQAFTLGFAVSFAVNNLPQKLAEFVR